MANMNYPEVHLRNGICYIVAYLLGPVVSDNPTTGTKLSGYTCKDLFKKMKYDFSVLCYDEVFYPNDTSLFPGESEICIDPVPCPLQDIKDKWNSEISSKGDYLTVDIDLTKESMEHGSHLGIQCAQTVEKFVTEIDPEGVGVLTYKCQAGKILDSKGSNTWDFPGVFQCQPVCTNRSIAIPEGSNFQDPGLTGYNGSWVFGGDKLTLTCTNESHLVNNDWSDKFEIKCNRDGNFESVSIWPQCVSPPNCGVPPTPNNASGLVAVNEDLNILVPNKAKFYCSETSNVTENNQTEVISYVTELGNSIEIPCENTTLDGDDLYNFTLPGMSFYVSKLIAIIIRVYLINCF